MDRSFCLDIIWNKRGNFIKIMWWLLVLTYNYTTVIGLYYKLRKTTSTKTDLNKQTVSKMYNRKGVPENI